MDDPDRDSTWEDDGEDGGGPGAGGGDGEAGVPGDAEDEEEEEEARPSAPQSRMLGSRNWRAMRDTRRYRHHYPDLIERDGNGDMPNLSFYKNEMRFLPNGCFIEDILQNWRDDYDLLEDNHSYIQWLFPLREPGVNWHAKPLTQREIEAFKNSKEAGERFVQAYQLMLGFYGMELEDRDTGRVCRAPGYQKRFQNLNWHSHNNLRITRILKSLGELGLQHYQAPLVRFFLEETLVHQELPGVRQSALDYFVFTVRCPRQRRALLRFAWEHFRPRRHFVWAPHDKLRRLRLHSPPRAPLLASPGPARGEESPGDPLPEACALERTCGPGKGEGGESVAAGSQPPSVAPLEEGVRERNLGEEGPGRSEDRDGVAAGSQPPSAAPLVEGARERDLGEKGLGRGEDGDGVAAGPQPPSSVPSKEGTGLGEGGDSVATGPQQPSAGPQAQERDLRAEAGSQGEEGPEPSSPKESKKRKLEVNRREQAPGKPDPESASEVEKIALNLEGCALSQGSLGAGTQEMGSQEPGEVEQPSPPRPGAKVADEVRKRRKVDQTPALTWPPAPSARPEAPVGENGVHEEGAPGSPAPAEPALDARAEPAEAGPTP